MSCMVAHIGKTMHKISNMKRYVNLILRIGEPRDNCAPEPFDFSRGYYQNTRAILFLFMFYF
jgi:hypothetical protein